MQDATGSILLSASDLSNFLSCRHRTALDLALMRALVERPTRVDPMSELLRERGFAHEQRYVDSLRRRGEVVDLREHLDAETRTIQAMRDGAAGDRPGEVRDWRVARLRRCAAACRASERPRIVVLRGLRHQAGAGDARRHRAPAVGLLRAGGPRAGAHAGAISRRHARSRRAGPHVPSRRVRGVLPVDTRPAARGARTRSRGTPRRALSRAGAALRRLPLVAAVPRPVAA